MIGVTVFGQAQAATPAFHSITITHHARGPATCPHGYRVIGGGYDLPQRGAQDLGNGYWGLWRVDSERPSGNSWRVEAIYENWTPCGLHSVSHLMPDTYAVCVK